MGEIVIPYSPHKAQLEVHNCTSRFRILSCGTKLGKTVAAANEALRFALSNPKTTTFWVAPFYGQCVVGWRTLHEYLPPELVKSENKQEMMILLLNDSVIQFKSAEIPGHLRGASVSFVVVDEAAYISEDSWHSLLTTITQTRGRGIFISTPCGHNYFYEMFQKGLDDKSGEYKSFTFPTSANPYVDPAEIESARQRLPKSVFQRDYLAEFRDDFGAAFDGEAISACIKGELEAPRGGEVYYVGADLGRHEDATVLIAVDVTNRHVCGFKHIEAGSADWNMIQTELKAFASHWNDALILVDSTGVGEPIFDELFNAGLNVEGYSCSSNARKNALVHKLAIALEQGRITFPNIEVLVKELRDYGFKQSEGGTIRYSAPSGKKDDCVISLALACWYVSEERGLYEPVVKFR